MSPHQVAWSVRAAALVLAVLVAGCTKARPEEAGSDTRPPSDSQSGPGVTDESIRVGLAYPDFEELTRAGIVDVDHGPYEEIAQVLVDDLNERGGIDGRSVELITSKFSLLRTEDQLATCTELTEDQEVFVVLNGLSGDSNLCIVQQHSTPMIMGDGGGLSEQMLAQSRATLASYAPTTDRYTRALVRVLEANGLLDGKTIGTYAAQPSNEPYLDIIEDELEAVGKEVAVRGLNDEQDDFQAARAKSAAIAQRMRDEGVDMVLNVGQYLPGADFDAIGFHPEIYVTGIGYAIAGASTNPLGAFPYVGGLAVDANLDIGLETKELQRCYQAWEDAGRDPILPFEEEMKADEATGQTAMGVLCSTMQIFEQAAKAAGPVLNDATFREGIESLGELEVAAAPQSSFGPGKYDGQDSFQLMAYNTSYTREGDEPMLVPTGKPIVMRE
jgi:ABC-type branched-subunit amino acid transport system substrate-binding protein